MVKEIWKYLHKPRYVDVGQLDGEGRTAAQVATANGKDDVAALLQQLNLNEELFGSDSDDSDDGNDDDSSGIDSSSSDSEEGLQ